MSVFWEVIVLVTLSEKKVYMYMYPIPNRFRDRAISLYSSKIADKKEILRNVANTGMYCSSDKVGTVYLV
jgi:predicted transport protein